VDLLSGIETLEFADRSVSAKTVSGPNLKPTAASSTLTTPEDQALVLLPGDFAFNDANADDYLQTVSITALPGKGALKLNGTSVVAGQIIAADEIADGKLSFTPASNASGAAYAKLSFKVSDGKDISISSYDLTINVTAVNDAPVFAITSLDVPGTEDVALKGTVKASDVDMGDTITYSISQLGEKGLVTINRKRPGNTPPAAGLLVDSCPFNLGGHVCT
jgi:hypothetical protein